MEAGGRKTPLESRSAPRTLDLPSAVNIAIPKLLALTRATGREHGLTFRYDRLGIIKANKVNEGTKSHSTVTTLSQRIIRQALSEYPPILLHTHSPRAYNKREHGEQMRRTFEPGFNMLPGKADIELSIKNPGALFLTASNFGVVGMVERERPRYLTSSLLLSPELLSSYLQLREKCRREPSKSNVNEAMRALADLWKPHGDVYVRFGPKTQSMNLVSPSEVATVENTTALAS